MDSASTFDSLDYLLPQHDLPSPGPAATAAAAAAAATAAPRGSKKRARASRRAPTTVLTTDASNFRAMVQEFTGIPSAPFATTSSSSSSSSSSLHLFLPPRPRFEQVFAHSSSSSSFSSPLNPYNNYLLRAFSSSSSSSSSSTASATTAASAPLVVPLGHLQNPILTFQSLIQSPALLPLPPTEYEPRVMGLPPGLNGPTGWAANGPVGSCKMTYTTAAAAAAEFAVEKVSAETVAAEAKGEGMVESWICSVD